jgi:hypothetical protein
MAHSSRDLFCASHLQSLIGPHGPPSDRIRLTVAESRHEEGWPPNPGQAANATFLRKNTTAQMHQGLVLRAGLVNRQGWCRKIDMSGDGW